jgi:ABC-type uncharacterized transport system involved in gliding motility auxiliary subunit
MMRALLATKRQSAAAVFVLLAILFLSLNVFVSTVFRNAQVDLTENGLFTLSAGTRATLKTVDEPITIRFYYSEQQATNIQQIRVLAERVRDMLQVFEKLSGGKVSVEEINPQPYTEAEDEAQANGLTGVPTSTGEQLFFGIAASNTIDGHAVLSFIAPEREPYLEYDLISMIDRLNRESQPVLGLLMGLPLDTGPGGMMAALQGTSQPYILYQQLVETFEVEQLDAEMDRVPSEVDVLMLVHPPTLGEQALYAIDQFVMRGGKVVAFLDPFSEISQIQGPGGQGYAHSSTEALGPLMKAWGFEVEAGQLVGDRLRALRVGYGDGVEAQPVDYVLWLGLVAEDAEASDIVTGNLQRLQLASVGSIVPAPDATTTFLPLIRSSEDSMLIDVRDAQFQTDPNHLLRRFAARDRQRARQESGTSDLTETEIKRSNFVVAARVTGPITSAFPGGAPDVVSDVEDTETQDVDPLPPLPAPIGQVSSSNILVIADSDIFDDQFWVQVTDYFGEKAIEPNADNGALVIGAAENLMGSNDLISLRSRTLADRSFQRVDEIRRRAEAEFLPRQQELDEQLDRIVARVDEIRGSGGPDALNEEGLLVTPEERDELQRLLAEASETRRARREIQRNLRVDIDRLETQIKFFNTLFVPLVVVIFVLGLSVWRRRQRRVLSAKGNT